MKRTLSFLLAVVMIFSVMSSVTVVASAAASVTSISYKAVKTETVYEEVDGYWSNWYDEDYNAIPFFRYNYGYIYKEGNTITLNYSNGKKVVYTYKDGNEGREFYAPDGSVLADVKVTSDQYDKHWSRGTNYYTLTYDTFTTKVPVKVVANPVASIKFTPAVKISVAEKDPNAGEWKTDYDGVKFFCYSVYDLFYKGGNKITVNYTNGKSTVFTFSEQKWGYYDAKGNEIDTSHLSREDSQYENPWVYGKAASFNAIFMGRTAKVPVKIIKIAPVKPSNVKVVNGEYGVEVSWKHAQGASSYRVFRKVSGQKNWSFLKEVKTNYYKDGDTKNGNIYKYMVRAKNSKGLSTYEDKEYTIRHIYSPYLKSVQNVAKGVNIQWYSVTNVAGYKVYRKTGNATTWTYLGKTTGTAYTDTTAKSGTTYTYSVRAYKGSYNSGLDEDGLVIKRLSNPASIKATSLSSGIKVTWNKVNGATTYYVYRKIGSGSWKKITTTKNLSYIDKTAKKGTTYKYTVKAISGKYTSAYNSGVSCKDKY